MNNIDVQPNYKMVGNMIKDYNHRISIYHTGSKVFLFKNYVFYVELLQDFVLGRGCVYKQIHTLQTLGDYYYYYNGLFHFAIAACRTNSAVFKTNQFLILLDIIFGVYVKNRG